MSELDFHIDHKSFRDLEINWEMACRLCFADDDYYRRQVRDAHTVVKLKALEWYDDDETAISYFYAPASKVRRRMEVQGYTRQRCQALWEREFAGHIARLEELAARSPEFAAKLAEQRGLTFESWQAKHSAAGIDKSSAFRDFHVFDFTDTFSALALAIDVYKPEAVWTEFTDHLENYDPQLTVRQNLDAQPIGYELDYIEATGNVLILTEGTSDTKILSTAIKAMYPELSDIYEFVDFEEFRVEGGVSMVTKMIKAFAGIRMTQRVIGLFDNDAAGLEQKAVLDRMTNLPPSIQTMLLPDAAIGKNYPTLGPEGLRTMDVNGSACSIELFLGEQALSDESGNLRPIRWSSWNKSTGRYQGELENKNAATLHFLEAMKGGIDPLKLRTQFPEMDGLLNHIFHAFNQ